jgi:16S rRNA (cytosine1402-N4)-methyltransferase
MDPTELLTAGQVVNGYTRDELARIIRDYGEEPLASRITWAIVNARPIGTTTQLADIVASVKGRGKRRIHPATRTFQAIRIEVNNELNNLERGITQAAVALAKGGRLVVISYHSLEDRMVKQFMRRESRDCICPPGLPVCQCGHKALLRIVKPEVITPAESEISSNPRSRSAKLRAAERI